MRIVSLLPSATEIVCALGLEDSLTGVSHECDYPPQIKEKSKIIEPVFDSETLDSQRIDDLVRDSMQKGTSLYRIRVDELRDANPDLIITQELCDVCAVGAEDVRTAAKQLAEPPSILSLDPHSLRDVQDSILKVGKAVGRIPQAEKLIEILERKRQSVRRLTCSSNRCRVFCAEWLDPVMNAGHWVPEMVEDAGGFDGLARPGEPSTYTDWSSVADFDPQVIVLMPCGFTTKRSIKEAEVLLNLMEIKDVSAVREGRVFATDGHNYFSRSGPRLFDGIEILAKMVHPELFREPLDPELGVCVGTLTAR